MVQVMSPKKAVSSFLSFIKSVAINFIPFYWLKDRSAKLDQLNSTNEENFPNRRSDNYKRLDVNNQDRGGIRLFSISLALTFGTIGVAALFTPLVGWGMGLVFGLVLGFGILPKVSDVVAKQAIRAISWLRNKNDPKIINATYPQKYKPYTLAVGNANDELSTLSQRENQTTQKIMNKLYLKNQQIKQNPESWFGLSAAQQEQCQALNLAVGFFRQNPHTFPTPPYKNPFGASTKPTLHFVTFKEEDGFTPQRQDFLNQVIWPSP